MHKIKFRSHEIELYDSLDMPALTYQAFNRFVMIDAEVGGTIEEAQGHIMELITYNKHGDKNNVQIKAQLLMNNFAFIIQGINPKYLSFSCLVHKLNGKPQEYTTDDNLLKLQKEILETKISHNLITETLDLLKKKLAIKSRLFSLT